MRSNTTVKAIYSGNDTTLRWSIPFEYIDTTEIGVIYTDADEVETEVSTDDYSVDTDSNEVVYPSSSDDDPVATGCKVTIYRLTDLLQESDFTNQGSLWPETIETSFDKIHQILQENTETIERCVKVDISSSDDPAEYMTQIEASVVAAAASASAAATSEENAANSEEAAEQSAEDAADSAEEAADTLEEAKEIASIIGVVGEPYDSTATYDPPDVVITEDGTSWRCIETSTGEYPSTSSKWVALALAVSDTFEYDSNGDLQPCEYAQASDRWSIDSNEDIYPTAI